ncbi:MAG: MarR family EPS-associated transcriptional regulator [Confluentimicrobium sp.]|nr:MarR family EPS-associated transcriptional regulator [Actibacterium sp.]|tara:strand:- start:191 stop:526 length:336 start_codon:yes stop_codon:yes gene_type:complete
MQEDMRFRLLRLLDDSPEMSQRDLARAVGVSLGSVNFQLKALVDKGLVKLGNFSANSDKRRYAYILTPRGLATKASLTRRFLARKRAEYDALRAEIEALQSEIDDVPRQPE